MKTIVNYDGTAMYFTDNIKDFGNFENSDYVNSNIIFKVYDRGEDVTIESDNLDKDYAAFLAQINYYAGMVLACSIDIKVAQDKMINALKQITDTIF